MFKKIKNPIIFQGSLKSKKYFEGWYFKQVSINNDKIISFIPGISLNKNDSHSFVQVIESPPIKTHYFRYDTDDFSYGEMPFFVKVGENYFSENKIELNLNDKDTSISGELILGSFQSIDSDYFMPNIMGVFAYIPKMDCNHGVISMNHSIDGQIIINDELINFNKDKGYLEKDWGKSFPKKYIWLQGNHFSNYEDSFMCSIADVPMFGFSFTGMITNLHIDGKEYRFATYNGAKIKKVITREDGVDISVEKGELVLNVSAWMKDSGELKAPVRGEMIDTIKEGLNGSIELTLLKNGEVKQHMKTNYAGIELIGEYHIDSK